MYTNSNIDGEERHKFFPLKKFIILTLLKEKRSTTVEILSALKGSSSIGTLSSLYNYMRQGIIEKKFGKNNEEEWVLTSYGKRRITYLSKRLEEEFGGINGLKEYIERKKKERKERENEENKL